MKHDDACELPQSNPDSPTCHCAERAFLADCSDEERQQFRNRRGYDTNNQTQWDLPPRRSA